MTVLLHHDKTYPMFTPVCEECSNLSWINQFKQVLCVCGHLVHHSVPEPRHLVFQQLPELFGLPNVLVYLMFWFTKNEDDQKGRQPKMKTTKNEDDQK